MAISFYMNKVKVFQNIIDNLLKLMPFKVSYSLSFNDADLNKLTKFSYIDNEYNNIILLLQGPVTNWNYLITSLEFYNSCNLFNKIVLTTWFGELSHLQIEQINNLKNIILIQNIKPKNPGISNINLQILSTLNGLKYIKLNYPFSRVIKSRTDQRLLNINCIHFLNSLLKAYPINYLTFKSRLIICSFNTFKYRVYSISDMFMYGHIDDLLIFWDQELESNQITTLEIEAPRTMTSWSKLNLAEVYLVTNFLKKIDYYHDWSIENYWKLFKLYFIVIDPSMIGLEWIKYTFNNKMGNINQFNLRERYFFFSDWLMLQNEEINIDYNHIEKKIQFNENIKFEKN